MKQKLVLSDNVTFEDAIRELDKGGVGFLPIVDAANRLLGIITDGDIRRAILNRRFSLDAIINRHPITLGSSATRSQARKFLRSSNLRHLPLVDDQNRFVDVVIADDIEFTPKPNRVVIMAGGLGTRLGPLTAQTPKPMLPVGNKPLLSNIISLCYEHGYTQIYLCVNYRADIIKEYFADGSRFGVSICYVEEKERLGTAGAISLIEEPMEAPFFVLNADILTTLNLDMIMKHHEMSGADATMCVKEMEYRLPYGVVNMDDSRIRSIEEKPVLKSNINAGIYVLNADIVGLIPRDRFFDMTELFDLALKKQMKVSAYPINDYWLDIGQLNDYETANRDLSTYGIDLRNNSLSQEIFPVTANGARIIGNRFRGRRTESPLISSGLKAKDNPIKKEMNRG
jgi:dTDP-glucose pyrophosphorylase/CBS domain-containing protein